jgi:hypothetical protein
MHLENIKLTFQVVKPRNFNIDSELNILKLNSNYLKSKNTQDLVKNSIYYFIASNIQSIIPFSKIAYPDIMCNLNPNDIEPLNIKKRLVCREKLLTCINRAVKSSSIQKTVYDLDALISNLRKYKNSNNLLKNYDELRINKPCKDDTHLYFESRFESGNLRKAIQVCYIYIYINYS